MTKKQFLNKSVLIFFISFSIVIATVVFRRFIPKRDVLCTYDINQQCIDFLENNGWKTHAQPFEVEYKILPEKFNYVYEQYNRIQLKQGYDLTEYLGKEVQKRVYVILNYPGRENDESIRADIFIADDKIIAADICCVSIDGFLHGVIKHYGNDKIG